MITVGGCNDAGGAGTATWLLCRAGTSTCALPIGQVIETMRIRPIEAVAGAPPYVRGLSIIRGAPVPVVEAGLMFGDRPALSERLVTMRIGSRTVALAVESVIGVRDIAAGTCAALPPLLRDAGRETIAAIGSLDAEFLFVLRIARIVPEDVLARLSIDGAQP
jgi:purine-binding chemotaxis protein CheW